MSETIPLTKKETDAFKAVIDNALENMGGSEPKSLHNDNFSWFDLREIIERTEYNRNEAAGLMSALSDKGLIADYGDPESGKATWHVTTKGIDQAQAMRDGGML